MRYYLDYNASAPMDEQVKNYIKEMIDWHGNPSSIHTKGRKLKNLLETSRQKIAALVNCSSKSIIFTSGATEANNLALNGYKKKIISAIEHESIKKQKHTILINVNKEGYIDLDMLDNMLKNSNKNHVNIHKYLERKMDKIFINFLKNNNEDGKSLINLASNLNGDEFQSFMMGESSVLTKLKIIKSMPKLPFIKQIFK